MDDNKPQKDVEPEVACGAESESTRAGDEAANLLSSKSAGSSIEAMSNNSASKSSLPEFQLVDEKSRPTDAKVSGPQNETHIGRHVVKVERPDGSSGLRNDYPDGGSREVISRNGKAIEYTFTSKSGNQEVWRRDGNTDNWYRSTDTEKKHPWTGSIEMKEDGRIIEQVKANGKISEVSKEGRRDASPDRETWKKDVLDLAASKIKDKEGQELFQKNIAKIEEKVANGEISEKQAAESYKDIYRIMNGKSQAGVSDEHMVVLAQQVTHNIANPDGVDQGPYPNCNTAAPEVRLYSKEPQIMARMLADVVMTGKYTDTKGTKIDISESLKPADTIHTKVPHGENERSYASQLFHLVGVNLEVQAKFPNLNLKYVQNAAKPGDNGDRLMDYSQNPPKEVYGIKDGVPVHESTPLYSRGNRLVDGNLQGLDTKPLGNPGLNVLDSADMMERISGKKEIGAVIGHGDNVSVNLGFFAIQGDSRVPYFFNEKELGNLLAKANAEGKMPILLQVDAGSGFLRTQVEEANGKTMGGEGGMFGGGHVLCIKDYDPKTGRVEVDNTWGSSRDKIGDKSVSLKEVVDISHGDPKLAAEKVQYEADLKGAYNSWCRQNNKTYGKDFPSPEEGQKFFKEYRERMRKAEAAASMSFGPLF